MSEISEDLHDATAPTTVTRNLKIVTETSGLPRERALRVGLRNLTNAEIMAILLGWGIKGKNVMDIANELAKSHEGHLSILASMTPDEMSRTFDGIGESKALILLAALELGRRAAEDAAELQINKKQFTSSEMMYELMRHRFRGLKHEEFRVLALNNSLCRIKDFKVNEGTATQTIVEIKKIVLGLIQCGAVMAVVFHNHPSGTLRPSVQDEALTRKIVEAAKLFDIRVIDHIIITEAGYYSFHDNGRL